MVGMATSSDSMHSLLNGNTACEWQGVCHRSGITNICICAHGGGSKVLIALDRRRSKERRGLLHLLHEECQQLADALADLATCAARLDHEKEKVGIEIEQQGRFLGVHQCELCVRPFWCVFVPSRFSRPCVVVPSRFVSMTRGHKPGTSRCKVTGVQRSPTPGPWDLSISEQKNWVQKMHTCAALYSVATERAAAVDGAPQRERSRWMAL